MTGSISGLPLIPTPTSLNEPLPTDKYTAKSDMVRVQLYPIDLNQVGPTVMNNEPGGETAAGILGASGRLQDVPPLDFVTISFWRAVAHKTYMQGTHKYWTFTSATTKDTYANDFKASVSGAFEGGTWSGSDETTVSDSYTVTVEDSEDDTFTVGPNENWQQVCWQWTTAIGYVARNGPSAWDMSLRPFFIQDQSFEQGEGHHRKNMGYQFGQPDWKYFGDQAQVYIHCKQYNAGTGALITS